MKCPYCVATMLGDGMFGNGSSPGYMNRVYMQDGNTALFMLMPVVKNGSNKVQQQFGDYNGNIKLEAYTCATCNGYMFRKTY